MSLFSHAVDVTGSNSHAEYNLGLGWEHEGNIRQALIHYYIAMTSQPAIRAAFLSRGQLLEERGKWKEAGETYFAMLADYPEDHTGHLRLAIALSHLGRNAEAASQLKAAMQTCPDAPDALNNLAWTLATSSDAQLRDGAQAVRCAERANDLTHHQEIFLVGTLAAAYAEAGRFDEAVATAQQACALASNAGRLELLKRNQAALELYRSRRPYREPADSTTAEPITATPGNGTIEKLVPAAP